jgi:NitT/TauT family transport system ATP-binding protein
MDLTTARHLHAVPPAAERAAAIEIKRLSYRLTDRAGRPIEILDSVDLTVNEGEFIAVVGPSGCGKSTLLNFISGLLPVQSGQASVFGRPVSGVDPSIGYVFQQHALLPWRNVLRNAEFNLEIQGVPADERRDRARKMLARMGLEGFDDHFPAEISGGMRQRVSLARTLVSDPRLILMDEPFGALDAQTKVLIQEMFLKYWEENRRTVVFITHDLAEAVALADRVLVMSARPGRLMAQYDVHLPRPRDFDHLRSNSHFNQLLDLIWNDLRSEVERSMRGRA